VIGKGGFRIPASAWREHVYATHRQRRERARHSICHLQWTMGRSFPTFCPMGRHRDRGRDSRSAQSDISLTIDGVVQQSSDTGS